MSVLGYQWYLNSSDLRNCFILLIRLGLPRDIRAYIKKYMYDYKCICNPIFFQLKRWSKEQTMAYESFQRNKFTIVQMGRRTGKTTLIYGIANMCSYYGIHTVILTSNPGEWNHFWDNMHDGSVIYVTIPIYDDDFKSADVILVDNVNEMGDDFSEYLKPWLDTCTKMLLIETK